MKKLFALAILAAVSSSAFAVKFEEVSYSAGRCGGRLNISVSNDGHGGEQLNIHADRLQKCSKMRVMDTTGRYVSVGGSTTIDINLDNGPAPFSRSITLPKSKVYFGANVFTIELSSNSKKTQAEIVTVTLKSWMGTIHTPATLPSFPAPVSGNSGSGGGI